MSRYARTITGLGSLALVVGLVTAPPALAADGLDVTFFAGTGTAGSPVPGPARLSSFNGAGDADTDADGNVYVVDQSNNQVEKITPSGMLSVVAGTGSHGDPVAGAATSSPLRSPRSIAVAPDGSFVVTSSTIVAAVDSAGLLTVVAGGGSTPAAEGVEATAASFTGVNAVGIADDGRTFLATFDSVFAIDDGALDLVAGGPGTSGAPVDGAQATQTGLRALDLAVKGTTTLYATDSTNHLVVAVDLASGTLTRVAGNGSAEPTPVPGPATASPIAYPNALDIADDGSLYVVNTFRVLHIDGGTLSVLAGNGTGASPQGGAALETGMRATGVAVSGDVVYVPVTEFRVLRLSSDPAPARPTLTLGADETIVEGDPLELTWTASGNDTLVASGDWGGRKAVAGGSETITDLPAGEYTFRLRADGEGGYAAASTTVTVRRAAATLTVKPSAGFVATGKELTVSGSGLSYFEDYTVRLSGVEVGSGQSEFDGTFSTTVTVPASFTTRLRSLTVEGSQTDRRGATTLQVLAPRTLKVHLSKPVVRYGGRQEVVVAGLVPGERVRIFYRGKELTRSTARAHASGRYAVTFAAGSKRGKYAVGVSGIDKSRSGWATFRLLP